MTSLAICLTIYGRTLMNLRWFALFAVFMASCSYWASSMKKKPSRWEKKDNVLVAAYLAATFMTVIAAENPLYSGLRWVSHTLMLLTLLVLLKNSLTLKQGISLLLFMKAVVAALLLVSWLKPVPAALIQSSALYQGAFGNSNALGQVATIGALLYLHGYLTDKKKWLRLGQIGMLCLASWIVWSSGSRSAMVAFLTGLAFMHYLYPKLMRGKILLFTLLLTAMALMGPSVPDKLRQVVLRAESDSQSMSEQLLATRKSVWQGAWAGFQKRPLLGWGFGADDGISKQWDVKLTALGTVTRDGVNDTVIVLESCGVVGLGAYVLLVILALRQIPTRRERRVLSRIHSPPLGLKGFDFSQYHFHAITFVLSASLLLMVQFDNTALSAGNFISVTIWAFVALSGVARKKAVLDQELNQRHIQFVRKHASGHPADNPHLPISPWAPSERSHG